MDHVNTGPETDKGFGNGELLPQCCEKQSWALVWVNMRYPLELCDKGNSWVFPLYAQRDGNITLLQDGGIEAVSK